MTTTATAMATMTTTYPNAFQLVAIMADTLSLVGRLAFIFYYILLSCALPPCLLIQRKRTGNIIKLFK